MNKQAMEIFHRLREDLFTEIRKELEIDGHCKSYEGLFEIGVVYPNYFEEEAGDAQKVYVIELHCYIIGPHRHYSWQGNTLLEAMNKADEEIRSWFGSQGEMHEMYEADLKARDLFGEGANK